MINYLVYVIWDGDLSVCERGEDFLVLLAHFGLDVVKEKGETFASQLRHLIRR